MTEQKEDRFEVIKISDIEDYLSESMKLELDYILNLIRDRREKEGKTRCNKYWVVNQDEPYADKVWGLISGGSYVKLAKDQSLPENPHYFDSSKPFAHMDYSDEDYANKNSYAQAQQDMLKAVFRKVEIENRTPE